tara:strand:- start:432 stop:4253 length:3822 start_codon:yes stop_codon:yes gene_type:complete
MDNIIFQIIDISPDDVPIGDSFWDREFKVTFYGKTKDDKNVVCNVCGFKPFFYIRVVNGWSETYTKGILKKIKNFIVSYRPQARNTWRGNYVSLEKERFKNFYGFNYDYDTKKVMEYNFIKVSFDTYGDMKKCISAITDFYNYNKDYVNEGKICFTIKDGEPKLENIEKKDKEWFNQEHNCECQCNLYEAKIHPMLRFLHHKNIKSCGWVSVKVKRDRFCDDDSKTFNVDIEIDNVKMKDITPIEDESTAGFVTASFDIECDSSHGDFPNPTKDFRKVAIDIHESYFRNSCNLAEPKIKVKFVQKCLKDCFKSGSNDVQNIFTNNGTYSSKSLKSIIKRINNEEFFNDLDKSKESSKTREKIIDTMTKIFNSIENEKGEKIEIKGDPIIQIGTVFHRFGELSCFERTMVIIGNEDKPDEKICDDIDGVTIYECKNEKELLLKWKDLILYHNPDIITGYNIFGFDFDYINKRVDYLFPCCSKCKKTKIFSSCDKDCPKNDFYRLGRLMRNRESDLVSEEYIKGIRSCDENSKTSKSQRLYNNYWEKRCQVQSKQLSSSGLGDNVLKYISMDGRIVFDIQKEIQKGHALESYKLDDVSAHFMKGNIINTFYRKTPTSNTILITKRIGNLKDGDYITININTKYGSFKYLNGKKLHVSKVNIEDKSIIIEGHHGITKIKNKYKTELISYEWCLAKDDVSPQQIFDKHKYGGSKGRAEVAKYCIMDCELCIHLLLQLDMIPNNIGMACVSWVPISYIFLRGQGIKINSIITKECSERKTRIPTLKGFTEGGIDDGFEGAIVLEPKPGIYSDDPVSVLDYASLYPSSIIEKNFSHETFIGTEEDIKNNPEIENVIMDIGGYDKCWGVEYDDYIYEKKGKTIHKKKADTKTKCFFVKNKRTDDGEIIKESMGIIPIVLQTLLEQRKATRLKIKQTNDDNKKKVLDGFQLAYKVTANSVYGQMGAKTSPVFFKKIAACTTAIGRERIDDASIGVKKWAEEEGYHEPDIVYGDTDSVFVKFSRKHKDTGEILEGKDALRYCIDCGVKAGEWVTKNMLYDPQDLEYEKTFYPFILISKKRYTGDKYELDHEKPKERTSMGIVMKRRDNAPICKYVFGNVIEIIMNKRSVDLAIDWLKKTLTQIKDGKMDKSMFIISKSLRGFYKNPEGVAHKVLADRMAERNPGNKPKPNDRIPYAYIKLSDTELYDYNNPYKSGPKKGKPRPKKILQGNRIEHPDYIKEKSLELDYNFYISNQIMNPVKQVLDLEKDENETKEFFNYFIGD